MRGTTNGIAQNKDDSTVLTDSDNLLKHVLDQNEDQVFCVLNGPTFTDSPKANKQWEWYAIVNHAGYPKPPKANKPWEWYAIVNYAYCPKPKRTVKPWHYVNYS